MGGNAHKRRSKATIWDRIKILEPRKWRELLRGLAKGLVEFEEQKREARDRGRRPRTKIPTTEQSQESRPQTQEVARVDGGSKRWKGGGLRRLGWVEAHKERNQAAEEEIMKRRQ